MINVVCLLEASSAIGFGHLSRCLALCQSLASRACAVEVRALTDYESPDKLVNVLAFKPPEGVVIHWFKKTESSFDDVVLALPFKQKTTGTELTISILDIYELASETLKKIQDRSEMTVLVDDLSRQLDVSLIIDPTPEQDPTIHPGKFRGGLFSLIRSQSLPQCSHMVKRDVLVHLGSETKGITRTLMKALQHRSETITWVLPSSEALLLTQEPLNKHWTVIPSVNDMALCLQAHTLVIGSGGVSALERLSMGIPSIVIQVADNQEHPIKAMHKAGAIALASSPEEVPTLLDTLMNSESERQALIQKGRALVDGHGPERSAKAILMHAVLHFSDGLISKPLQEEKRRLRRFEAHDDALLYVMQTVPGMRQYSRNPEVPSYEEHKSWFCNLINDASIRGWIIEYHHMPIGMLRLNQMQTYEEVSILLLPSVRGLGFARWALEQAAILAITPALYAYVHPDNTPSIRLFLSSDFKPLDGALNTYRRVIVQH